MDIDEKIKLVNGLTIYFTLIDNGEPPEITGHVFEALVLVNKDRGIAVKPIDPDPLLEISDKWPISPLAPEFCFVALWAGFLSNSTVFEYWLDRFIDYQDIYSSTTIFDKRFTITGGARCRL